VSSPDGEHSTGPPRQRRPRGRAHQERRASFQGSSSRRRIRRPRQLFLAPRSEARRTDERPAL